MSFSLEVIAALASVYLSGGVRKRLSFRGFCVAVACEAQSWVIEEA
jgi:hypothetical protein